jgi:hypothetical protein
MACHCSKSATPAKPDITVPFTVSNPIVIYGSRSYQHEGTPRKLAEDLNKQLTQANVEFDCIVSGGAEGVDRVGECLGVLADTPVVVFNVNAPATWHSDNRKWSNSAYEVRTVCTSDSNDGLPGSGKAEPYLLRNCYMAEWVATKGGTAWEIWDGQSNGTAHMRASCNQHGVPITGKEKFTV